MRSLLCIGAISALLGSVPALEVHAQDDEDINIARARQLFERGVRDKDCSAFRQSLELKWIPAAQMQVAACDEAANPVAAMNGYDEVLSRAKKQRDSSDEKRLAVALERREVMRARIATLTLKFKHVPDELRLQHDTSKPMPLQHAEITLPLNPGTHVFSLDAPGYVSVKRTLQMRSGESTELELTLDPQPAPVEPARPIASGPVKPVFEPPANPTIQPAPVRSSLQSKVGYGVGAVGVAALVTAAALGIRTLVLVNRSNGHCRYAGGACDARGVDLRQDAGQAQTVGFVLLGVGVAGLGAGLSLVLTAPEAHGKTPRVAFVPSVFTARTPVF